MLSLTSTYAVRSIIYLAQESQNQKKIGIRDISQHLSIPYAFLGKVLQTLARHNIISSQKGPSGGFYLDKNQMNITVWQVIQVFDNQETISGCVLGHPSCDSANPCPMHNAIFRPKQQILDVFKGQTVGALAKMTLAQKLKI